MEHVKKAMDLLEERLKDRNQFQPISFDAFLLQASQNPLKVFRNVFQVFHDMVYSYVGPGVDEYPGDPESVGFHHYEFNNLFVDGADNPFFADRIFANRFVDHVKALKSGSQQNKIYVFDGPPGCGKSTFLNNLLKKFEEYANTEAGFQYETLWRLNIEQLGGMSSNEAGRLVDRLTTLLGHSDQVRQVIAEQHDFGTSTTQDSFTGEWSFPPDHFEQVEVACPSHDHPILMVPKESRRGFVERLLPDDQSREMVLNQKEFEWIFKETPCTICSALIEAILEKLEDPAQIYSMLFARPYRFNRRLGEGISVFNPGDKPMKQFALSNPIIQTQINSIFRDSNLVHYMFSRFAKTNNGIYALMDVKSHNTERLIELHNIISEGVHKVEFVEEKVNSLFMAVMNPEDRSNVADIQSFTDRIQYVNVPYVLDYKTEVQIYLHIFGQNIHARFLPRVLDNFARVVVSTRLMETSPALLEWIKNPADYHIYCDDHMQLLKMDLYTGYIPVWLAEEHRNSFNAKRRRKILGESINEGKIGFSGRDSIKIFGEFYTRHAKGDSPINMSMLCRFFRKPPIELKAEIRPGFMDSLLRMYNFLVLQEVKESLYYYNEEQITRDILNYMFALNFEIGTITVCTYTGDRLEIKEDYLQALETRLLSDDLTSERRKSFRNEVLKEYTSRALTQEVLLDGKPPMETKLFQSLHERYVHNLKQKALDPFLENENFRRAITDYHSEDFKAYDKKIRSDVDSLINNLINRYGYSPRGAQEICIYVIDEGLAEKFK